MNKKLNHECLICGTKYHACDSCEEVRKIKTYKAITDTSNHYQIYLIVNDYCYKNISKEEAYKLLAKCDLNGKENFKPNVLKVINEILETKNNKIENEEVEPTVLKVEAKTNVKAKKNKHVVKKLNK